MTLFRKHRGSLDESMKTCIEVHSFDDLYKIIHEEISPYKEINRRDVSIKYYCNDYRINWPNTHIVIIDGFGVIGFTDGEL